MENDKDFLEKIKDYFQGSPGQFGWILILTGSFLLWGSIKKWEWIFQGDGRIFNIVWFREQFGEKAAQTVLIFISIVVIVIGILWSGIFRKIS